VVDRQRADGIPDGRIGVWNIPRRELRRISPPGRSMSIDLLNGTFTSGGDSPAWSADGRRIVFQQYVSELREQINEGNRRNRTTEETRRIQLWAVNRDGQGTAVTDERCFLDRNCYPPLRWSDKGDRVSTADGTEIF